MRNGLSRWQIPPLQKCVCKNKDYYGNKLKQYTFHSDVYFSSFKSLIYNKIVIVTVNITIIEIKINPSLFYRIVWKIGTILQDSKLNFLNTLQLKMNIRIKNNEEIFYNCSVSRFIFMSF